MSPLAEEEKAHQFCGMAAGGQRVGISEFARGKTWRNLLAEAGCVEVTDRAGTIGLLLTPDYAEDVSAYIAQLESELEQAYVRALFEMRADYSLSLIHILDDMLAVFDNLAFTAEIIPDDAPLVDERRRAREAARAKRDRKVFGAAAVLTVIIVAIGMIPGWHMGMGSALAGLFVADPTHVQAMFAANLLLLALTAPVQFGCGARFYKGAWGSLKGGSANMDVLVALGTSIAFLFSLWITFLPVVTGDWESHAALAINDGMPYFCL